MSEAIERAGNEEARLMQAAREMVLAGPVSGSVADKLAMLHDVVFAPHVFPLLRPGEWAELVQQASIDKVTAADAPGEQALSTPARTDGTTTEAPKTQGPKTQGPKPIKMSRRAPGYFVMFPTRLIHVLFLSQYPDGTAVRTIELADITRVAPVRLRTGMLSVSSGFEIVGVPAGAPAGARQRWVCMIPDAAAQQRFITRLSARVAGQIEPVYEGVELKEWAPAGAAVKPLAS